MEPALSRGDTVKLKIDSTPQAIVVSTGIITVGALAGFLVWSGWDAETIVGMAILAAGLFTGQYATTRRASILDAKQDQQTVKIDTVMRQTNGELKAVVSAAVSDGIARGIAAAHAAEGTRRG